MKRIILAALCLFALAGPAAAQSGCKYIVNNAQLTPGQWNYCFGIHQDALGFVPVNRAGDTMQGRLVTATSGASGTLGPFNVPPGSAPASPANGDIWTTASGIFARINNSTVSIGGGASLSGPVGTILQGDGTSSPFFTGTPVIGNTGVTVGSVGYQNNTSGTLTVKPPDSGALGSNILLFPVATDTLIGKATTDTLTNKTFDTAGTGNSLLINGLAATANTGTGAVVRAADPTITGHPTIEGVTSTGATGTGNIVYSSAPTVASLTVTGSFTATGLVTNADLADPSLTINGTSCMLGTSCNTSADACQLVTKTYTPISITTNTTTRIVAPTSAKHTYICSMLLSTAAANNVAVVEGTGGTCGAGTAGVVGGTTTTNGLNFAANGGVMLGAGDAAIAATAGTNVDLCLITSAATPLAGVIAWVQQ